MIVGTPINLGQLETELTAAGIVVNALGTAGPELFTYTPAGAPCELPEGAAAVVAAHVPAVSVDPDAELDAAISAATTFAQLRAALLGSRGGRIKARPGA